MPVPGFPCNDIEPAIHQSNTLTCSTLGLLGLRNGAIGLDLLQAVMQSLWCLLNDADSFSWCLLQQRSSARAMLKTWREVVASRNTWRTQLHSLALQQKAGLLSAVLQEWQHRVDVSKAVQQVHCSNLGLLTVVKTPRIIQHRVSLDGDTSALLKPCGTGMRNLNLDVAD